MQVRKQQLELDMQQQTGSKQEKEYVKAVYWHSAYFTSKAKWLSEEALQIAEKRRKAKGKGEKERYTNANAEFQRIARRDKKAFPSE